MRAMPNHTAKPLASPIEPDIEIEKHRLEFTGSGGEYFRVWIVNVLLSIVTLGFYTPWARRRTALYFYSHTLVADSPLEFTAQQRKMVMGFILLMLLTVAYNVAVRTGQDTAVALLLLGGALLAPYIWASAMRFRLGATRWRGLRLQFSVSWREVYARSWPVFALALVWFAVFLGLQYLAPEAPPSLQELAGEDVSERLPEVTGPMLGLIVLGLVLTVLCIIRLEYNYKGLLVQRTYLGKEAGRWKPVYMDFVWIWLATVGVAILSMLGMGLLLMLASGSMVVMAAKQTPGPLMVVLMAAAVVGVIFLAVLATAPARAYREARMFRLQWSNIGVSRLARFKCRLRTWRYVMLRLKNMLLSLLTLGLYRPFALVAEYRMKVESVTLHVKGGVDQVAGALVKQQSGGLGDALADAAGLDLIG